MQRISKVESLVEGIERHQDRIAIFERDVLDARQRTHAPGNVLRRQVKNPAHDPFQFKQNGHRDERWFRARCNGCGPLSGGRYFLETLAVFEAFATFATFATFVALAVWADLPACAAARGCGATWR